MMTFLTPHFRRPLAGMLSGTIAVLWFAGLASAAEPPKAAGWFSPKTLLYVEVMDPNALIDRGFGGRVQGLLRGIPDYAKFLKSEEYKQFRTSVNFIAAQLDTTWRQGLTDALGGSICMGLEVVDGKPRIQVVVAPRDAAFLAKLHETLVDIARKDAAGKKAPDPIRTFEHRGITAYSLAPIASHAIVDGHLVISAMKVDPDAGLRAMIDRALDLPKDSLAVEPTWLARRSAAPADSTAWGLARLDLARSIDPDHATIPDMVNPGLTFLLGAWIEAARKAPWVSANLTWKEDRLGTEVAMPSPEGGYTAALAKFVPGSGVGAPALVSTPKSLATISLWRDLSSIYEARSDLFPPEFVQGLAGLDNFAGLYFGGRDFGTGVLGALTPNWRLVVASQDFAAMDPVPANKLPAFALMVDLKPDDEDFSQRLKIAFQSFIGIVNVGAAQEKAPPLVLGSETVEGVTIATSHYLKDSPAIKPGTTSKAKVAAKAKPTEPGAVHSRHNFSPAAAQVGDHFILSSSTPLARDLVRALKAPAPAATSTLLVAADGHEIAEILDTNHARLVMNNMVEKGNDKAKAEGEVAFLSGILRFLGKGQLSATDTPGGPRFKLDFQLGSK